MNKLKPLLIKENLLGYGTGRIVFDLKNGNVIKIPYNNLGIKANYIENENYTKNKDIVAEILEYKNNIIIQEKLTDIVIIPLQYTKEEMKEFLESKFPNKDLSIVEYKLNTRVQVGLDKNGELKFYDYEEGKLNTKFIIEPFIMTDEWIDMCLEYIQQNDLNNIEEYETFEDHRGFLTVK